MPQGSILKDRRHRRGVLTSRPLGQWSVVKGLYAPPVFVPNLMIPARGRF
jgi:hypothetical protein